ncbi:unnamed protein product, partial [Rotaria socialis]
QKIKSHVVFLVIASIIVGASVVDYLRRVPDTQSDQYYKLSEHILAEDGEGIRGMKSLIAIELVLIALNGLLIVLFFGGSTHFLQPLRLSITLTQYLKIYLIICHSLLHLNTHHNKYLSQKLIKSGTLNFV